MIPLFKVFNHPDSSTLVNQVLESGYLAQGPMNDRFEKQLAEYLGDDRICTVNSCTSAIHLAIDLIKRFGEVGEDCQAICSPLTCAAGIWPFMAQNIPIVWCDVNHNVNIDLRKAKELLTEKTQILSFVNWGGKPVNYTDVINLQTFYKNTYNKPLYIVEDCAHAFGAEWHGNKLGTVLNDCFACYSFQAIKSLTTGDGGLLIPPRDFLSKARKLRWFGLDRDNKMDFRSCQDIPDWGYKFHMNDVASAIGIANLPHIDKNLEKHRDIAKKYRSQINNRVKVINPEADYGSSWWLYTLLVNNKDKFIEHMNSRGIQANPVHTRVDKNGAAAGSYSPNSLTYIDVVENHMVCIPIGWWLTDEDTTKIVEAVNEY